MIGTALGPYRIESGLGTGGMGAVWRAVVTGKAPGLEPGALVAVKVIHPHLLETPGFFKRFLREAEIGRSVRHENVVRTHDADAITVEGTPHHFLVMEYVEGQTLRALSEELPVVPEELCRHIGREVARGLAAIHEAGVVHRDLKPENVLITPEHAVKIMDLGVARLADEAIRLSQTGAFVGSLHYAAPEQILRGGEDVDGRADLYALGLLLYELACGQHPHRGDDAAQVIHKVLEEDPRRLGDLNPQASPFFEEVIHSLLRKDRDERFASATELLRVLEDGESSPWWQERARTIRSETRRPLRRIRIPRETAVYGREEELARLGTLYERAKAGDGQVVLIEGEAGIGKSRLVDELVGRLQQDGEDLNFLFGSYPPGGAATASGAWSTAYREHFGAESLEETLREYLTATPILVPAFSALLRGEPPPEGKEPLTKDSLQTVFVHATRALAKERPTVVLIEDLHFAPEEGRAMFAALALAVPGHPVLLVGTARPGISEDWRANLERLEQASRMELPRLGPKDLARLLEEAFHSERLATELGHRIALKSDGNPFFVFEIIRGLREGQFITRCPDGTWITTKVIQDIQIPSSVQDLIQARIADLDEEEQELLDVAACCGFEFDPTLVAEVLDLRPVPALRRLGHLEKSHRMVRSVGRDYAFDHHQVQEALYGALGERLRERYHAAIGDALLARHPEPDGALTVDLCEHFLKGGEGEKALPHLDGALDHLASDYQNDATVSLVDRALAVTGLLAGEVRAELLLRQAGCLDILGRREEERAALEEALEIASRRNDVRLTARARTDLGRHLTRTSRFDDATAELDRALELARQCGDLQMEARAVGLKGEALRGMGRYQAALAHFELEADLSRRTGDGAAEATALWHLGQVAGSQGRLEDALAHFEQSRAISIELGLKSSLAAARNGLGLTLLCLGMPHEAREHLDLALAAARELGDRGLETIAVANLGSGARFLGEFEAALAFYERWSSISQETGDRKSEGRALVYQGYARMSLGDLSQAGRDLRVALTCAREIGARGEEADALASQGSLQLLLGEHGGARESFTRALELHREAGDRLEVAGDLRGLARLAEIEGGLVDGRRLLEESLEILRDIGDPLGTASSHRQLGSMLADAGDFEGARRHLEEARTAGVTPATTRVLATSHLAALPGGDVERALEAYAREGSRLGLPAHMEARFLLWKATSDPAHLAEAHRMLSHLRDHAPEEHRDTMIANVPLHRDITAAWQQHGG